MSGTTVSIPVSDALAQLLPTTLNEQRRVLELGLKEWKLQAALDAYRRGEGSLAYHAEQLGIPLREMIPLAYAHGLTPATVEDEATLDLKRAGSL